MIPRVVSDSFDRSTRGRGDWDFRRGAVHVTESSPALMRARVDGTNEVTLERHGKTKTLAMSCSCPEQRNRGRCCPHLWAVLRMADQRRWLGTDEAGQAELPAAGAR